MFKCTHTRKEIKAGLQFQSWFPLLSATHSLQLITLSKTLFI